MRKTDYTALAVLIRRRLDKRIKNCVRDGIVWCDESHSAARELVEVAEEFARVSNVDRAAFLSATGADVARVTLHLDHPRVVTTAAQLQAVVKANRTR